jgi:hypothetical protein
MAFSICGQGILFVLNLLSETQCHATSDHCCASVPWQSGNRAWCRRSWWYFTSRTKLCDQAVPHALHHSTDDPFILKVDHFEVCASDERKFFPRSWYNSDVSESTRQFASCEAIPWEPKCGRWKNCRFLLASSLRDFAFEGHMAGFSVRCCDFPRVGLLTIHMTEWSHSQSQN